SAPTDSPDLGDRHLVLPARLHPALRIALAQRVQPGLPDHGRAQSPVRAHRDDRRVGEIARRHWRRAADAVGALPDRESHEGRHGDPCGGRGPGGGEPHGDRRQPDHLAHVPDRRRDGRRRGGALRRAVRADQSLQRLHSGPEGLHRGRARRDRQHPGRDGGRARPRAPRGVRRGLSLAAHRRRLRRRVQGHPCLLDLDLDPDLQAQGPSRRDRAGAGMIHSLIAVALVALSALAVATFPRSVLVFLLFQGSLLFVFKARIPERLRWGLLGIGLLVLIPVIGYFNSYYLEVATQVGIFVALALGLNIVVGPAGLLDLGYVAFFAVGAYSWAIF